MSIYEKWISVYDRLPDTKRLFEINNHPAVYQARGDFFITDGNEIDRTRSIYVHLSGEVTTATMPVIAWLPADSFKEEVIPRYVCPPIAMKEPDNEK